MKVIVDRRLCEDNGICVGAAPQVFDIDAKGRLVVLDESPVEALRASVEEAALFCPVQAISISDEN